MQRTPVSSDTPACWSTGRGEDCGSCRFKASCDAALEFYGERRTVAQLVADLTRDTVRQQDVDDLLSLIRHAWETVLRKPLWAAQWSAASRGIADVLPTVISSCMSAGWDPALYVQAQVQTMTPVIRGGGRISGGCFVGAKAQARFERWATRRQGARGSAQYDIAKNAEKERFTAAATIYLKARCLGGSDTATATTEVRNHFASWRLSDVDRDDRLRALFGVLSAIDASLPHRIYLPADATPTWSDIRALCERLRHAEVVDDGDTLSELGEMV